MRYYGEYIDANGKFQNMFFDNWQDWREVTFDPRCTILIVRDTMSKSKIVYPYNTLYKPADVLLAGFSLFPYVPISPA